MKTRIHYLCCFVLSAAAALLFCSCERILSGGEGTLRVCFAPAAFTRAAGEMPDTNLFILSVVSSKGEVLYKGRFCDSPESFRVSAGSYTVKAVSREFSEPLFDAPQFGDEQVVLVGDGEDVGARLYCRQTNSGVRLAIGETFAADYPDATLYLKSAQGPLVYSYSEKRTGYFLPGSVWLDLEQGGTSSTLLTRVLEPQQVLTIKLDSGYSTGIYIGEDGNPRPSPKGIHVCLDTARTYISENFLAGGQGSSGGEVSTAYGVGQARQLAQEANPPKGVWVSGFIVGGDCTSSSCSFSAPFKSNTNLLIAARTSSADKSSCLAVQLSKGDIRDALNLVDHPENVGRQVRIKGDLVAKYYGIAGIQNVSGYLLE